MTQLRVERPLDISPETTNPHGDSEGFLLPSYDVELVGMRHLHKPETLENGVTIHHELAEFHDQDGRQIKREVTVAQPSIHLPEDAKSPFPIIGSDPWMTGARGLNRYKTKRYAETGFPVVWVHHAGRYSPIQPDKSVSRAAHQEHVLLNHLSNVVQFDTDEVIGDGYSRGAMTREKFIAEAAIYGRKVPYSDLDTPCFAQDMTRREKVVGALRQLPSEILGIASVGADVIEEAFVKDDPGLLLEFLGTFDPHPKNIAQEIFWAHALVNSRVGKYVEAMPTDTQGVRTFLNRDFMSQQSAFSELYAEHPNIRVSVLAGRHVDGARPRYIDIKVQRLARLFNWIQANGRSFDGFDVDQIYAPQESDHDRRHLRLIA